MTTQKLPKVFIVGESGTTGLRLHDRLISRSDIELLSLPDEKRKDIPTIVEYAKNADLMFLCLPDDASREIVKATEGTGIRILDTSTAHRTKEDWVYGFPELSSEQYKAISQAEKVAVLPRQRRDLYPLPARPRRHPSDQLPAPHRIPHRLQRRW